ncbi:protein kinase domain-containing protein [Phormidium sp. CCY1219]|uniref:protein kinase domain-containing protein n=1 Tax=Phormidium sp. CCY1219 TaxID=2886104 RepID=UPI002D1E90C7|nr:protein kinase [Phormidium sp. CCY1219]MEB3829894.1 protein kinase [Phormidium sp. CCY1219]
MTSALLNNRYRILKELGSGGFGQTFLAEDTQMPSKRRCVIKQLKPVTGNPQIYQVVQERFAREAAILEQVGEEHPQIPKLFAYFELEGQFYLVQELIEGVTLTKKVQTGGPLSEGEVRSLLAGLLPVLEYLHGLRLVHRDIKPDNIILRSPPPGRPRGSEVEKPVLIDFGAVKETMATVVSSSGGTTPSIAIGTPGFMPPEQAAGRPLYSSDLYSLAVTAVYLLTGKLPQELEADPATGEIIWRQHAPSVSPGLAGMLDKAMRFNPRSRYSTAREMLDALQPAVNSDVSTLAIAPMGESTATPPVNYKPPHRRSGTRRFAAIAGGVLLASFLIGFAIARQNIAPTPSDNPSPSVPNTPVSPAPTGPSDPENPPGSAESPNTPVSPAPTGPSDPENPPGSAESPNTPVSPAPTGPSDPENPPESSESPNPEPPTASGFYYLADSAFKNPENARNQLRKLKQQGYNEAGSFWLPDYPNLSASPYEQVYVAKFRDRDSCIAQLKSYGEFVPDAYCAFASDNPNAAANHVYASDLRPDNSSPSPSDRPSSAQFIRSYYENINDREYRRTWSMLSPEFQRTGSESYQEYVEWWDSIRQVRVRRVNQISTRDEVAIADVALTYNKRNGKQSEETLRMTLIWDEENRTWAIDKTDVR